MPEQSSVDNREEEAGGVIIGVDTHKDFHVAAALDRTGQVLDTSTFATTTAGYAELLMCRVASVGCRRLAWKVPDRGAPGWPGFSAVKA